MKVCYTAIGGGYDLPKPIKKTEGWTYIMFTNEPIQEEHHNGWEVVLVQDLPLDNTRFARYHKHNPYRVLKEYPCEESIWVDGNLNINANLDSIIKQLGDFEFVSLNHPHRNCIYDEGAECIRQNKDDDGLINSQLDLYKKEGFPVQQGMLQSGILIRKHNKENVINFQQQWWDEILRLSKRDQLSFNYIKWKNPDLIRHEMLNAQQLLFDSRFFPINIHKHGW